MSKITQQSPQSINYFLGVQKSLDQAGLKITDYSDDGSWIEVQRIGDGTKFDGSLVEITDIINDHINRINES